MKTKTTHLQGKIIAVFIFLIAFFTTAVISAQPLYTQAGGCNSAYKDGDTIILKSTLYIVSCDTTGITAGVSGANVTWDFSQLKKTSLTTSKTIDTTYYLAPSKTPYGNLFPNATLASLTKKTGLYSYSSSTPDSADDWGTYQPNGSTPSCAIYSTPAKIAECPFGFGNTYTTVTHGTQCHASTIKEVTSYSKITWTYDAYGTLKLPTGDYATCIRLVEVGFSTDTIFPTSGGFTAGTPINSTTYQWLLSQNSTFVPLMEIELVNEKIGNTVYNFKLVDYFIDSNLVVTGVQPISASHPKIIISPNPFNTTTSLEINDGSQSSLEKRVFVMYDMLGNEVKRIDFTGSKLQIEKENMQSGMYFYRLNNESYSLGSGKFIIE